MLTAQLLHQAAIDVLAAAPTPAPTPSGGTGTVTIDASRLMTFMLTTILPPLLMGVGLIFVARSKSGQLAKILTSAVIVLLGLAFIGGAGSLHVLGEFLVGLILGQ